MDLTAATVVLVRVVLVVAMLSIGLRLVDAPRGAVGLSRRLAGSLVANLIIVPMAAVVIAAMFGLAGGVAIGFLAVAAAAGGSLGPKLVQVARGNLHRGVLATVSLGLLATVTLPPTLGLSSRALGIDPGAAAIDARLVLGSLAVFQLAPLVFGVAAARARPALAARALGPITSASTVLLVVLVVVAAVDTVDELTRLGPGPLAAMVALGVVSGLAGWLTGGGDQADRRTSCVVTAQRSGALALLVVSGPGHAVEIATVTAFALVLLAMNTALAWVIGGASGVPASSRGWQRPRLRREEAA